MLKYNISIVGLLVNRWRQEKKKVKVSLQEAVEAHRVVER
jgi:hypothetical protein